MSDPQPLSPEQEAVRGKIVAAGEGWGFTEQQVDIAVRVAFQESAFGRDIDNPNSSAYGLYQYTYDTWMDNYIEYDRSSMDDQILAFYQDLAEFTGRWLDARSNGEIPADLSLGEYVYVLHHDGRYSSNEHVVNSAARDTYKAIADYYNPQQISEGDEGLGGEDSAGWEEDPLDEMAFWAELADTPIYDMRFPGGGGGYVGDTEYIPPDGGPPITIPGDGASAYDYFW